MPFYAGTNGRITDLIFNELNYLFKMMSMRYLKSNELEIINKLDYQRQLSPALTSEARGISPGHQLDGHGFRTDHASTPARLRKIVRGPYHLNKAGTETD